MRYQTALQSVRRRRLLKQMGANGDIGVMATRLESWVSWVRISVSAFLSLCVCVSVYVSVCLCMSVCLRAISQDVLPVSRLTVGGFIRVL